MSPFKKIILTLTVLAVLFTGGLTIKYYQDFLKSQQANVTTADLAGFAKFNKNKEPHGYIIQLKEAPIAKKGSKTKIKNEHAAAKDKIKQKIGLSESTLKSLPEVKAIYKNGEIDGLLMDSVPLIKGTDVWQINDSLGQKITGKGVKIAIIDTGVDYTHPDLGGCYGVGCKVAGGYDFINKDNDPMDDQGHGTHVSATAAGNGVLKGVAPDATIYSYKVLDSYGHGEFDGLIAGVERATDPDGNGDTSDHVDVISMSLGAPCGGVYDSDCGPDDAMSQAIDASVSAGVVNVVAGGNSGPAESTIGTPGTARKALTVAASFKTDLIGEYWGQKDPKKDQVTNFSSRGPVVSFVTGETVIKPDITAPGAYICAAEWGVAWSQYRCLDGKHVAISGTSMATPHVSGAVALIKQAHPEWTVDDIIAAIKGTAVDLGYPVTVQGQGRIDVLKAVGTISSSTPLRSNIITFGDIVETNTRIMGTAAGTDFTGYTLSFAESRDPSLPKTTVCSSKTPVLNGLLCTFSTDNLKTGSYTLYLTVTSSTGEAKSYSSIIVTKTKIDSPTVKGTDVFNGSSNIPVVGTSNEYNFDHYTLVITKENGQAIPSAISMTNNGLSPLAKSTLGIINSANLPSSGAYTLTLTTFTKSGTSVSTSLEIFIDTRLMPGWPIKTNDGPISINPYYDQPTIADIDNDGKKDIITAYAGLYYVRNYKGQTLSGWPQSVNDSSSGCNYQTPGLNYLGPAVADINNDGFGDIVGVQRCSGSIIAYNHDGSTIFGPAVPHLDGYDDKWNYYNNSTVTITDINNDSKQDILVPASILGDVYLYALDSRGAPLAGWPVKLETFASTGGIIAISAGDLNNDGTKEIVAKTGNNIYVLNNKGQVLPGWPKAVRASAKATSVGGSGYGQTTILVDLNKDGKRDIVTQDDDGKIHVFNMDGTYVPGWPVQSTATAYANSYTGVDDYKVNTNYIGNPRISVGDVDGDGKPEIVSAGLRVTSSRTTLELFVLEVYNSAGSLLERMPKDADYGLISAKFFGGMYGTPVNGGTAEH
jgi:subtilisin family serine protease